jgi:Protein of unknown function DUF72
MSGAGLPCVLRATTDFVYVRMHCPDPGHLYAGSYPEAGLHWWADRISGWGRAGQDVFVYFNNDGEAKRGAQRADPSGAARRMTACGFFPGRARPETIVCSAGYIPGWQGSACVLNGAIFRRRQ